MRFVAAFWVVMHHFGASLLPVGSEFGKRLLEAGSTGVTFFFVLSGFILAVNYPVERLKVKPFLLARFARIYPLYALALLVSLPAFYNFHVASGSGSALGELLKQTTLCALLLQAWLPDRAAVLNPPSWSLSAEAFFYAMLVPALLWNPCRRFLDRMRVALPVLWGLSLALPLWWVAGHPGLQTAGDSAAMATWGSNLVSFHPLVRLPEFLIGVVLGRAHMAGFALRRPGSTFWFCAAAILGLLAFAGSDWGPLMHNGLTAPLFGFLILASSQARGFLVDVGSARIPVFLGEASYALYILHVPVHQWMQSITAHVAPGLGGVAWHLLYVAAAILASSIAFVWIETPARKAIRKLADRSAG